MTIPIEIIKTRRKRTTLIPTRHKGSDSVMTPPELAARIVNHFQPKGNILDPCRGDGAFFNAFPQDQFREWCEVTERRDFFTFDFGGRHYDWIVSNPPWSQFRLFTDKAMQVADNVVWFCTINAIFMKARLRDLDDAGFGIKEIVRVEQPSRSQYPEWPQSGLELGCVHVQKGWTGDIKMGKLP